MSKSDVVMRRARQVNPVPPDAYEDLPLSAQGRALVESILREPAETPAAGPSRVGARSARGLRTVAGRAALVLAATCVVLSVVSLQDGGDGPGTKAPPKWSPALVALAERAPRLLVEADGWMILRAEEYDATSGEMYFADHPDALDAGAGPGHHWLSLYWYPARLHDDYVDDRARGAAEFGGDRWEMRIAGHGATVFEHPGTALGSTFYALWVDGEHGLELRSDVVPTADQFERLAATLREVDTDSWLAAMPSAVVTPDERAAAVDRILEDIPVPTNVDVDALKNVATVTNSLEHEVVSAVACGWIRQWAAASESGDEAARREATAALGTARQWDALARPRGTYEAFLFDVADAMAEGERVNDSYSTVSPGVGYLRHFGCVEN
jgi:hypothetical protein